jgi:Cu-Zn family superoxide dismutase
LLAALAAAGLTACTTAGDADPRVSTSGAVIAARLAPTGGSTVTGLVTFRPFEGGVTIAAQVAGLGGAGRHRIAIHATGNCSSPNAFSAGAPLSLPGSSAPAVIEFSADTEGRASVVTRIAGLTIDRLDGRSVVVHDAGDGPLSAEPGVRNGRVACGVIGTMRPLV